jgi:hypothetical protein
MGESGWLLKAVCGCSPLAALWLSISMQAKGCSFDDRPIQSSRVQFLSGMRHAKYIAFPIENVNPSCGDFKIACLGWDIISFKEVVYA